MARKVLLIGWDSADWRVIHPLLDAGKLPHLEQLINGGVMGNLATLYPVLSPMLWTSIATGKRPHKHGIHGFAEPDPHTGGVRPITNLSRKTKAVWNILSQEKKQCIVVGWWPSHPAEPLPGGVMVSNHFQRAPSTDPAQPWPMAHGTVHPARLAETLAEFRLHPAELDGSHILPFIPQAAKIDQAKDRRLESLARIIADCTSIHAAATQLIANEPWDFMAVYYDAIDHFGHGFMKYHPPRQKWVPKKDFDLYHGVIEAAYCYHDLMLGVLMAAAGPDTTILLMSDHGFHPDHLRPVSIPVEPAGPAVEHRHYGIFVLKGPGIKADERVYGATVLDICPTLLTLFDLPVGRDMDGKPIVTAWHTTPELKYVPSWDEIEGEAGVHPASTRIDAGEAREAIKQLEALGYIQPLPEDSAEAVAETNRELQYNLACSYLDARMPAAAAGIFARLWREKPDEHRYGARLLSTQLATGRLPEARRTLQQLKINRRHYATEARAELKRLQKQWKDRKPEEFTPQEQMEWRRLAARSSRSPAPMLHLEALLLLAENKPGSALKVLDKLEKSGRTNPDFYLRVARAHLSLKQWKDAEKACRKALKLDSDHAQAHQDLAQIYLAKGRNFEAAGSALTSIGLLYHNPMSHFVLGVALHRLGQLKRAEEALLVCTHQNANFVAAHRRLAVLYENRLKDPVKAAHHREMVKQAIERARQFRLEASASAPTEDLPAPANPRMTVPIATAAASTPPLPPPRPDAAFATIVSGLPRSGTSLMMQMLAAGGLPPLHDGHRPADHDNPRGYFEFAPAKNIRLDHSWIPQTHGRALKLVAQLLPFLPPDGVYRVIFMERALEEVLASQEVMLKRLGQPGADLAPEKLRGIYEQQLARVGEVLARRQIPVLRVNHAEAIAHPNRVAGQVRTFLDLPLDCETMAAAIDASLYRQRREE